MDITPVENEDIKIDIEDHFVLRLPTDQSRQLRSILQNKPKKLKKVLSIELNLELTGGVVTVNKKPLQAKFFRLPVIIESHKTMDKTHLFKTADISHLLICQTEPFAPTVDNEIDSCDHNQNGNSKDVKDIKPMWAHGLTPPLKNVKKYRFRKTLKNTEDPQHTEELEKEVLWLLRTDNEAVTTRYEILYDQLQPQEVEINEQSIFGEVISDSNSDQDSSSSHSSVSDVTAN